MSDSTIKHPQTENDKINPVSGLIFFCMRGANLKKRGGGGLFFSFSQISTSNSHNFLDMQQILDCDVPKLELNQQFKNVKTKLFSETVSSYF